MREDRATFQQVEVVLEETPLMAYLSVEEVDGIFLLLLPLADDSGYADIFEFKAEFVDNVSMMPYLGMGLMLGIEPHE